jgi:formate dehydrogenase major subunit/formate dehydrogenase alpha subunit
MTETAKYADVFLPAACYAEKDGTFTNTERRVQRVRKAVEPPGQCRADWQIIADLSCRLGHEMHYDSPEEIFDEMRSLVPSYAGITYERIDKTGLQWPCPDTDHPGTKFLHANGFTRGKGLLQGIEYEAPAELCSEEYPILLTTGRMLYHYNIMTRYSANLEGLRPHELAQINPIDAAALALGEGDMARVTSRRGSITTHVTVTDTVPEGVVFMTFHYKESPVNELTNAAFDQDGRVQGLRGAHRKGGRDRAGECGNGRLTAGAIVAAPSLGQHGASRRDAPCCPYPPLPGRRGVHIARVVFAGEQRLECRDRTAAIACL